VQREPILSLPWYQWTLVPVKIGTSEHWCQWTFVPVNIGTSEHWYRWTLVPVNMVPVNIGTGEHWYQWTLVPVNIGTSEHWYQWTFVPVNIGTGEHWYQWTLVPVNIGTGEHWYQWTLLCCWQPHIINNSTKNVLLCFHDNSFYKNVPQKCYKYTACRITYFFKRIIAHYFIKQPPIPWRLNLSWASSLLLATTVQETSACNCTTETVQVDKLIVWESFLYTSLPIWFRVGFLGFQWVLPYEGQENALWSVHRSLDTIPCHLSVDKAKTVSSTSLQNYHLPDLISMPCEST
jgi:hypothetical protein